MKISNTTTASSIFLAASLFFILSDLTAQSRQQGGEPNSRSSQQSNQRTSQRDSRTSQPARTSKTTTKNQPVFGAQVATTPKKASVVKVNSNSYRYNNGIFYHPRGNTYVPEPGPVGARISILPSGYTTLMVRGLPFFYFYGTFYTRRGTSSYEVIEPPIGAVIYDLPLGFEKVFIDNITYYVYGSTYYKAIIDAYGEVAYEVVGKVR